MTDELDAAQRLEMDALDEEYRRRYGVAVAVIKAEVGPGEEYANPAARALISKNGAWFECVDLPMEFSGAAGSPVRHRFVSDADACALLDRLRDLAEGTAAGTHVSLFALYERSGIQDERGVYVLHDAAAGGRQAQGQPRRIGAYRPGALPLVFRCKLDIGCEAAAEAGLSMARGVIFCLSGVGERNLVVEMPYEGSDLRDLAAGPENPVVQ